MRFLHAVINYLAIRKLQCTVYVYINFYVYGDCSVSSIDVVAKPTLKGLPKVLDVIRMHLVLDISSKRNKIVRIRAKCLTQAVI